MPLLSDSFDLIRVINLPDRTDRYKEAVAQLGILGLKFKPGSVEIYPATRPTELAGFPSLGARGCFLSHLDVLRDAQKRGVESVLVIEDDFEVSPRNAASLAKLPQQLKTRKWGFVYLGHVHPTPASSSATDPHLIESTAPLQTTHMYGVHKSALGPLLEYLEGCLVRPPGDPIGGPMHVDGAFSMFRAAHPEVITLIAEPSMASQRSSRSDITAKRFEQVPGIKQAMSIARKLKRTLKA